MAKAGLNKLRKTQRFELSGQNGVTVKFGKYANKSFKDISEIDPLYFDYLADIWFGQMTAEVQRRLNYWRQKSSQFYI